MFREGAAQAGVGEGSWVQGGGWRGSPPTLKTLTSLNKEVRLFFLSDNRIWSFPSVSCLSDYSIWRFKEAALGARPTSGDTQKTPHMGGGLRCLGAPASELSRRLAATESLAVQWVSMTPPPDGLPPFTMGSFAFAHPAKDGPPCSSHGSRWVAPPTNVWVGPPISSTH